MKTIGLVLGLILAMNVQAQVHGFYKPDYTAIEQQTKDKGSLFFYPSLLKRYMEHDTTLSMREYRLLYYGYIFQSSYSLYGKRDSAETIQTILSRDQPSANDWQTLIRLEQKYLQQAPFDMRDLHLVYIAYSELGNTRMADIYHDKILKVAYTIMSTGDGKTEATAFHVISVAHEYDILKLLGLHFDNDQRLTENQCDYLKLAKNEYDLEGMYFDVKQLFLVYAR